MNNIECPFCGSEKITSGELKSFNYNVTFRADTSRPFVQNESLVLAEACLNCGKIFDLKLKNIEKVNR